MSTAILTGPPVAGSPLEGDLRSLGFDVVVADDASEVSGLLAAAPAAQRVAVVDPRLVAHLHALRLALTDPRFPAAAIPGALSALPQARPALARATAVLSGTRIPQAPVPAGPTGRDSGDVDAGPVDALASALEDDQDLAGGLHRVDLGALVAVVPPDATTRAAASAELAAVDDEAIRLRTAVKSRDGFFTTHFISPYSRYLARWCARRGLTPNQVTTASLVTALIAAGCAATGTRGGFVAAGVLLLASFFLDCTDGQLARYSLQYSTLGAWLDATFDRAKEYAYYAGLALGAARGGDDVWALALGAMVLQTCRHLLDNAFNEANADATAATAPAAGGAAAGAANSSPTAALSDRLDSVGWTVWARRMVVLPIGERWALIAVLTACATPRITFVVLLVGSALAACYTSAGRLLRSVTRRARRTPRAAQALADLADAGPLSEALARGPRSGPGFLSPALALVAAAVVVGLSAWSQPGSWLPVLGAAVYTVLGAAAVARPLSGPLDWLVPAFFRAGEYVTVLLLAARSGQHGALPAAFGLVAAVAYHHYDTVYRIRGGSGAPPKWLVRATGGHEGRTLLVTVLAALLHPTGFPYALATLAGVLALLVLAESIRFWVASHLKGAPAVHDEGEPA